MTDQDVYDYALDVLKQGHSYGEHINVEVTSLVLKLGFHSLPEGLEWRFLPFGDVWVLQCGHLGNIQNYLHHGCDFGATHEQVAQVVAHGSLARARGEI